MERLYCTCGNAVLHSVEQDGLDYFHCFRHPERLYEITHCQNKQCQAQLDRAMVFGDLSEQPPHRDPGDEQPRASA